MSVETTVGSSAAKGLLGVFTGWIKERIEVKRLIDLHKRRIKATLVSNLLCGELCRFREVFLHYALAERNGDNQLFFDKWLQRPNVVMGSIASNVWTKAKIGDMLADLAKVHV